MTYSEKLKDPRWQKRRLEILNRDNFTCIWCGDTESELHVHHLKYHKDPWDASDEHLITLCHRHHSWVEHLKCEISIQLGVSPMADAYFMLFSLLKKRHFTEVCDVLELLSDPHSEYFDAALTAAQEVRKIKIERYKALCHKDS